MTTAMMRPVIEPVDSIGFEAIELMGAVHFDTCVRYLKDDPRERIRLFRSKVRSPLQGLLRSRCALSFELQPEDINRLWVERQLANGMSRLIARSEPERDIGYLYDDDNRLIQVTENDGTTSLVTNLGYDDVGNLLLAGQPGADVSYTYDPGGQRERDKDRIHDPGSRVFGANWPVAN